MFVPHVRHSRGGRGGVGTGRLSSPFASRRRRWVRCVAAIIWRDEVRIVDERLRTTVSTIGATLCPHVIAVSESPTVNDPIRRHVPFLSSKNHSRRITSRVI